MLWECVTIFKNKNLHSFKKIPIDSWRGWTRVCCLLANKFRSQYRISLHIAQIQFSDEFCSTIKRSLWSLASSMTYVWRQTRARPRDQRAPRRLQVCCLHAVRRAQLQFVQFLSTSWHHHTYNVSTWLLSFLLHVDTRSGFPTLRISKATYVSIIV